MNSLKSKWCQICAYFNKHGIPMPLLRDPKTGRGSVSLTLVFLSFNLWIISIIEELTVMTGKIDVNQTFNMVLVCFGLYYGRKLSFSKGSFDLGESDEKSSKENISGLDSNNGQKASLKGEEASVKNSKV